MIFIEFLLQGEARLWWNMEEKKLEGKTYNLKDFQETFLCHYVSTSEYERRKREFLYLKKDKLTVMQYDRKFHNLSHFVTNLVGTKKDRVERFQHGLKPTIQKDLAILDFATHTKALDKALQVENVHNQVAIL